MGTKIKCQNQMSQKIFDNNLIAICKTKLTLRFNKPAYVGMCQLDLSRVLMYIFNYEYIKNRYGNKARLLFNDTNSLIYEITTQDIFEDFRF